MFSITFRGGVILEELILRMSLSGRAILHRILPRDYILSYAPCRGSVSWEIHLSKAQWCQHVGKDWDPVNTSEQPNLSEVALFLWL